MNYKGYASSGIHSGSEGVGGRGNVPSYKKGGKVRKTGIAKLHKGEKVIPKKSRHKKSSKKGGK